MKKTFYEINNLDFGCGFFAQSQYEALGILELRRCQVNQGADFPFKCYRVIQVLSDLYSQFRFIYESIVNTHYGVMGTDFVPILILRSTDLLPRRQMVVAQRNQIRPGNHELKTRIRQRQEIRH